MHFRAHDCAAARFPPATRVKPTHREKVGGRMSDGLKLNRPRQNRKRCILGCTTAPSEMDASRLTAGSWRSRALREWCDLGAPPQQFRGEGNFSELLHPSAFCCMRRSRKERAGGAGRWATAETFHPVPSRSTGDLAGKVPRLASRKRWLARFFRDGRCGSLFRLSALDSPLSASRIYMRTL